MKAKWNTQDKMGDKNVAKIKDVREKMSKSGQGKRLGKLNHKWRGDMVGYDAMHTWILNHWGKATRCFFCKKTDGRIHWANKDGKYLRSKRDNWIQLCPVCHWKYDSKIRQKLGRRMKERFQ